MRARPPGFDRGDWFHLSQAERNAWRPLTFADMCAILRSHYAGQIAWLVPRRARLTATTPGYSGRMLGAA